MFFVLAFLFSLPLSRHTLLRLLDAKREFLVKMHFERLFLSMRCTVIVVLWDLVVALFVNSFDL